MRKIVDLHCDTISALVKKQESLNNNSCHFDLTRAKKSGICIQFFALFSRPDDSNAVLRQILKQIEKYYREISLNQQDIYPLSEYKDVLLPANINKIGCILHLEGAEALGSDIELINIFYRLGLRSIGLTWNYRNMMADGIHEGNNDGGISNNGRQLLKELSKLGIILDLAHLGERSFFEAVEYYDKPLIVSHANVRNLCSHSRNLSNEQLKALQKNGGVVGVTAVKDFVGGNEATMENLIDHIVYISELIGSQHAALGSDFDGADHMVMSGIEDYQNLDYLLEKRGFTAEERENILSGNALRIIEAILCKEQPDVI
ncbi:MAG TPA: dipeptidase [Syntrophomonadaceae bacterium]|nr:dipeptidase [Syntrophomonadaceae bacterium]HPR93749.1 dipeptidase [Syntrophomonadaceae bacterium]